MEATQQAISNAALRVFITNHSARLRGAATAQGQDLSVTLSREVDDQCALIGGFAALTFFSNNTSGTHNRHANATNRKLCT